jgi:hypothetical protein
MSQVGGGASGLSWEDTRGYLNALDTLLTTTPDTDALTAWRSAKSELQALLGSSAATAKRALGELQGSLARAEAASAEAALPLEELRLRLEQVDAKKTGVLERVQRMVSARDASAAGIQALLQATLALKEEQRRMEAAKKQAAPQLQCVRARARARCRFPRPARCRRARPPPTTHPTPPSPPQLPRAGTSWPSTLTSRASSGTTQRTARAATSRRPATCRRGCSRWSPPGCPRRCRPRWPSQTRCGQRLPKPTACPLAADWRGGGELRIGALFCIPFCLFYQRTLIHKNIAKQCTRSLSMRTPPRRPRRFVGVTNCGALKR